MTSSWWRSARSPISSDLPGLASHAITMKTLGDAIHLRNRIIATLEEADNECPTTGDGLMTFVVAGGGFAGVETIAGVNDFVREALPFYPRLRPVASAWCWCTPDRRPAGAGREARDVRGKNLQRAGSKSSRTRACRRSRLRRDARGWQDHPEQAGRLDRGHVAASAHSRSSLRARSRSHRRRRDARRAGWPGVWSLGDCAVVPDRRTGKPYPPTAQHAIREAKIAARNSVARLRRSAHHEPSASAPSASSQRLAGAPVSPASSASTFPASSPGGYGARFI